MKKSLLLMLMVATAALGSHAATNYGINVAGVEVSSSNYNNVTGGNINGGTVKYDPNNKILTLSNVSISRTGGDNYGVHNRSVDGLTMRFVGTCTIDCKTANALHLDKSTTVSITGTLNAKMSAGENYGRGVIYVNDNATVWFQGGGTLNVTGNMKSGGSWNNCATAGFEGKGKSSNSVLNISNLKVVMNVTHNGIYKFRTVSIHSGDVKNTCDYGMTPLYEVSYFNLNNGVACVTPADAYFNSSTGAFNSDYDYTHFTDSYGVIISTNNFPNSNFRSYMRSRCSYDGSSSVREEYLTTNELMNLTSLDVSNRNISSLTGVGLLTYLTSLNCSSNSLSSLPTLPSSLKTLNISGNSFTSPPSLPSGLQTLYCGNNRFTSLTITGRSSLKTLDVSNSSSLTTLNCSGNALTSLNVSSCSAMTSLTCSNNSLSYLSSLPSYLQTLKCASNSFSSLPTLPSTLTYLDCGYNQFTSLPSLPSNIEQIYANNNRLTGVNTVDHTKLKTLNLSNNTSLTSVGVSRNYALTTLTLTGCSALKSLSMQNVSSFSFSSLSIPSSVEYFDCGFNNLSSIPVTLPSSLKTLCCYHNKLTSLPTLPSGLETLECNDNLFTSLSVTGKTSLKTLRAEDNSKLTLLNCSNNALTSINISNNTAMTSFNCAKNQLTSLPTLPSALQELYCGGNKFSSLTITGRSALKTLDVNSNSSLTSLNCSGNALTSLDVSDCSALQTLNCGSNPFTTLTIRYLTSLQTLNVDNNNSLNSLDCSSNALTSLSLSGCTAMTQLDCHSNRLTSLPTLPNSLQSLYCGSNRFTSLTITGRSALKTLDVTKSNLLKSLDCSDNVLTTLLLSNCPALETLNCYNNKFSSLSITGLSSLKTLDASNNPSLTSLVCSNNALTSLNISNDKNLQVFNCSNNQLNSLNLQEYSELTFVNCSVNKLTSLSLQGCNKVGTVYCYRNQIDDSEMTSFINSLRTISVGSLGELRVLDLDVTSEGNVFTKAHVSVANSKRWLAYKQIDNRWVDIINDLLRGDLNDDEEVDVTDVDIMIDLVLGKSNPALKSYTVTDLTHDGLVDVSDVDILIDLVLGKDAPEPGVQTFTVNGVSFEMIDVKGGTFTMGENGNGLGEYYGENAPAHQVHLSNYSIGKTEVTQALWKAVMGSNPSGFTGNLERPVENVSWADCQTFITKLNQLTGKNFRLPTEAEWEYAAMGGCLSKGYRYSGDNTIDFVGWYSRNADAIHYEYPDYGTHTVATKRPNELGIYDMTGNVREFCQDWFGDYSSDSQDNPTGPTSGSGRVVRGGSWTSDDFACTVKYRSWLSTSTRGNITGLRIAL